MHDDPVVLQLLVELEEDWTDLVAQCALADRLAELGEEQDSRWVRGLDLDRVALWAVRRVCNGWYVEGVQGVAVPTDWEALTATLAPDWIYVFLGLSMRAPGAERERIERSVAWRLAGRVYDSSAEDELSRLCRCQDEDGSDDGDSWWEYEDGDDLWDDDPPPSSLIV